MKRILKFFGILAFLFVIIFIIYSLTDRKLPVDIQKDALSAQLSFNEITNKNLVILIDYRKPIFSKRLWLYDIKKKKILLHCHVSHALNSGLIYARKFSNIPETRLSSKGSFVTQESYTGKYGYSMRISGLEESNNNVRKRTIVFHPLVKLKIRNIVLPRWISLYSFGCFALNSNILTELINQTQNGTLLYVCGNDYKDNL